MKKKYVLLMFLITAIVVGPFAYQRWSEARRLGQIRQAKQQAAQIDATPLADFNVSPTDADSSRDDL